MSYSPGSVKKLIDFLGPYMSCSDCKHTNIEVTEKSCCHRLCERCSQTHKCNKPTVQSFQPPSWTFMKDLYQQLNKISHSSKSFSALSAEKDLRMPQKCSKRPHWTTLTKDHVKSNECSPKKKSAHNAKKKNENKNFSLNFNFADPEAIITRYKTHDKQSNNEVQNEMPILVREDNQEKNCFHETRNPDKLDECIGTFNSTYDNVQIVEAPTLDSSHDEDENCYISNKVSSSVGVVPTESLPGPSEIKAMKGTGKCVAKLNPPQEISCVGFRERDAFQSLIRYLQFKMIINNSSSERGRVGNSEIILMKTNEVIYNQIAGPSEVRPRLSETTGYLLPKSISSPF